MPNTCSIKLTVDKLPKIINKIEFFMFRAMEQKGIDFYKISQQPKTVESIDVLNKIRDGQYTREQLDGLVGKKFTSLLMTAANLEDQSQIGKNIYQIAQMVHLFDTIKNSLIPSYINDYAENSKISEDQGEKEQAEDYKVFATNLQSLITMWDQIAPNFLRYSDIFNVKAKFTLNDDMLVDLNDIADDEKKMANKMVFDKPANEIDPIDDIDQAIELFIRSIPAEDAIDEYGFTSSVNYASLVRQMFSDLQNSIGMDELMRKMNENKEKVPAYKYLLNKLEYKPQMTRAESQFRINFRNSFVKAFVPIFITSIEQVKGSKNVFKVTEAASGKTSLYERIISSNFALHGMPVVVNKETGETINLAHEDDGVWKLDSTDIPKIQNYLEKFPLGEGGFRSVQFLKGLGFEFSEATEKKYIQEFSEIERKNATREKKYNSKVDYIKEHLFSILLEKPFVLNPIKEIKKDLYSEKEKTEEGYSKRLSKGQNNVIADIIAEELKNNVNYNIEKSVITAEGTRMHAIQLHNNFTVLNKYLSDPEAFPRLQDIIDNEPSMFWLDPEVNPAIRKSLFLNSLFFFDPTDMTVDKDGDRRYGKRRRVIKKFKDNKNSYVYSSSEGEFVKINLVNTGGLQLKLDGEFGKEGSSSTSLNEFDKILQDLHNFMPNKKSFNSILRLGDKSTDLGVGLNYSLDVTTGEPAVYYIQGQPILSTKPLAAVPDNADVAVMVRNPIFLTNVTNALDDFIATRFLGKQGFYDGLTNASKNILSTWGYFDGILTSKTKQLIDKEIDSQISSENPNLSNLDNILEGDTIKEAVEKDIINYFTKTADTFYSKVLAIKNKLGVRDEDLVGSENLYGKNLHAQLNSFVLNNFISDLEQMKVFFGDAIYFKDFHKRASKDSATGVFAFVDNNILEELNDTDNAAGIGAYTNLSGRRLIDRLFEQGKITGEQRNILLHKQKVNKSFKSAVLDDIKFQSEHAKIIAENIAELRTARDINGNPVYISDEMEKLYNDSINKIITNKYNGKESDGQGKCTFDFYRIMSRLTGQWSDEQEVVYGKIIDYNHYDELADEETDPAKRAEYIAQRDAVGYDPLEAVYFPPKKFQYSGPMLYERTINGQLYAIAPPIFDKFSLQPLIPTVIKRDGLKTTDWHLARKMELNGIGYVKFESGSKVETPNEKDTLYEGYDPKNPSSRIVREFSITSAFKSEQTLFFNHLKEQVTIDAEIHDHAIFGSQIRKLILMNLDKPEFQGLKDRYVKYIGELAELEKTSLYNEMGITKENGKLKINDFGKIVEYFFTEIAKKNQDSNVKKALKYDETTGKFDIPLDAAVQAQVLEGIIISAINNRIVRYKTNGSMLIQMAITGSERARLRSDDSAKALEQYGNENLNYFTVKEGVNGEPTITKMDVKISLTGQWLKLLELDYKGAKIGSINRLNAAIRDEEWLKENEKAITMVAYRIPTQGRNFLDVMRVKEFLPAAVGDAIVMPKEVVIKSGSDFDIDKMFVFYPNLDKNGRYISYNYDKSMLNEDLESKKNDIVSDLNYLKLARRTTLQSLNEEFKVLQLGYKRALRKDTNARRELNKLLRRVETIMAVLDAEAAENNKTALSTFAAKNAADDSVLSSLIKSNVSYNLAEHQQWMQETGENIYNPMLWIDTKREGLATLRDSIENLYNSDVDYLKLTRDQNKEYIDNLNNDLQTEISHVYDKLYAYNHIKQNIQNKLYETMQEVILHPANYMELVTPSDNFHVMPILDDIFEKLGFKEPGKDREPTDYKNTRILERQRNYEKFISLLKGKTDLGIAAVANTFNVMLQLAKAGTNDAFLYNNNINTFFFNVKDIEKSGTRIGQINFDNKFDEDGVLKSEFFSEFINAFVDVAKDDYVFAANVVTELSPVMFYMKFAGMSSKKILSFINQPGIRAFTKNLSTYQNKFAKLNGLGVTESARKLALKKTLVELGYSGEVNRADIEEYIIEKGQRLGISIQDGTLVYTSVDGQGNVKYTPYFSDEMLMKGIRPDGFEIDGNKEKEISPLSERGKLVQVAMLLELENQRKQSNSVTEAQKFLNFDTNPFSSTYDIYSRNNAYEAAMKGSNILSPQTLENIKKNSIISSLDMSKDMRDILEELFPVRNNREFNEFLSDEINTQKQIAIENNDYFSDDDAMKLARTAKNDYMNYILQNFIGYSNEGMEFFHSTFETDKSFNEYMTELVQTSKLKNELSAIKSLPDYEGLCKKYPFIRNIVIEIGDNNRITSFRLVENSSNQVEKESVIRQFEDLVSLENFEEHPEDKKIRTFFRNLALYSIFQSGMNTSDISYTNVAPVSIVNKLYGAAINEYNKLNNIEKSVYYPIFYRLFVDNNPTIFKNASKATPILDTNNRGKWYSKEMPLRWEAKKEEPEPKKIIPVVQNVVVNPKGGIKVISQDDVAAYQAYLQKSNGKAPKEFFTGNTTFKEFYNPATGRREKAPQSSKWILQDNGLYNLIDKDSGELYIEDVDLRTGIKMVEPVVAETARTIYDRINKDKKTQSENVILPNDLEDNTEYTGKNFWDKIVPEAKDMFDNKTITVNGKIQKTHMLIAYRGSKKKTFLQNYKDGFTVGNPFDWQTETGTRDEQGIKSTKRFIHWMITGDNMGVTGATEEYRQAIINDIKSGKIKKSPILYYQEKEYATHATALDYLINKYDWNAPVQKPSTNPLVAAGIKPTDMYGNAAKDIQMASESTQFIGFGTIMKEGNVSSTNKYAAAWGDKANTGNYSPNDTIMVSGSGNFGRGGVDKTEEAAAIKKTLTEKYKPLLEKAIAVGASFRIGNQYAKGNLSDELVAKYLQQKGYTEEKLNGYSKWTAPVNIEKQTSTVSPKILKNEDGLIIAENVISKADTIKIAEQAKELIEKTSFKQTAGSVSWGYGKQWMRINAMSEKQREGLIIGKQLNGVEITQKMKDDFIKTGNSKGFPLYGYTTIDKNGNKLPSIPKEIINYLSSIGIDISQYDASYNSVYDKSDNGSLIIHQDNSENNKSPIITMSLGRPMKFITYELKDPNDFSVADTNNTAFRIAVNAVQGEALKLNLIPASAKDAKGNIKYGHLTPDTLLKYAEEIDKKQGTQIKQFVIDKLKEQFKNAEKTEYTLNNGAVLVFSGNSRNVFHEIVFDPETNAKPMESGFPTLKVNKAFKGLGQKDNIVSTNDYRIVLTLRKVEGETLTNVVNQEKFVGKPTEEKKMPKKPFERTFTPPTRDAQGNVISPEVKSEETIGPGKYVKFNGETYIVTKVNANGTIQIYNPLKEGTDAKKSVAKTNLEVLKHSANIVTYRDTDYIVTSKGIIISLATNKIQKWGEENGDRKAILALANKTEEPAPIIKAEPTQGIYTVYNEFTEDWEHTTLDILSHTVKKSVRVGNKIYEDVDLYTFKFPNGKEQKVYMFGKKWLNPTSRKNSFRIIEPSANKNEAVTYQQGSLESSISNWMKENPTHPLTESIETLANRYKTEKVPTQTIEEFLDGISC